MEGLSNLRATNYDFSTWLLNCTDYYASIVVSLECSRCSDFAIELAIVGWRL